MFAVCSDACLNLCLISAARTLTFKNCICTERCDWWCVTATETVRMQERRTDWVNVCQEQRLPHAHAITYNKPLYRLSSKCLLVFAAHFLLLNFVTVRSKSCFFHLRKTKVRQVISLYESGTKKMLPASYWDLNVTWNSGRKSDHGGVLEKRRNNLYFLLILMG